MKPFFSIIIPTYNRAKLIGKTVVSILNQAFADFELIIVDDGGSDETKKIIDSFSDVRIRYFWKPNGERGAARNFGFLKSSGQYINFFDSDDIALPNHLSEAYKLIQRNNDVAFFHLAFSWANDKREISKRSKSYNQETLNSHLFRRNILSCNGVFLRREVAKDFPFSEDPKFIFMEDYLLWLKIGASFPLLYSNVVTSLIIEHTQRSIKQFDDSTYQYGYTLFRRQIHEMAVDHVSVKKNLKYLNAFSSLAMAYVYSTKKQYKLKSLKYILKVFSASPFVCLSESLCWVSLKNILIR